MTYSAVYCALISKRLQHPITRDDCYCESHHIIPKSEGGRDDKENLVNLTAREHYIAHLLLAKIYDDAKMWCALVLSAGKNYNNKGISHRVNSRMVEKAKLKASMKRSQSLRGKPLSKEHRDKWVAVLSNTFFKKGQTSPFKGRHHTEESRRKLSEANKGNHLTEESRLKLSKALKGKPSPLKGKHLSEETKRKISIANKGRKPSHEAVEKQKLLVSKRVCQYDLLGNLVATFSSSVSAAKYLGVSQPSISMCCRGINKTCRGFIFKYAD